MNIHTDLLILAVDMNTGETVATFEGDIENLTKEETIELLEEVVTFLRKEPSMLDEEENEDE